MSNEEIPRITDIPDEEYDNMVFMAWCLGFILYYHYEYMITQKWHSAEVIWGNKCYFQGTIGLDKYKELYKAYYEENTSSMVHKLHMDFKEGLEKTENSKLFRYTTEFKQKFICEYIDKAKNLRLILKYVINDGK